MCVCVYSYPILITYHSPGPLNRSPAEMKHTVKKEVYIDLHDDRFGQTGSHEWYVKLRATYLTTRCLMKNQHS